MTAVKVSQDVNAAQVDALAELVDDEFIARLAGQAGLRLEPGRCWRCGIGNGRAGDLVVVEGASDANDASAGETLRKDPDHVRCGGPVRVEHSPGGAERSAGRDQSRGGDHG